MGNKIFEYYLDTNAVRSLASRLDECANVGAFISVWTICEMLGHIIKHPENFGRIRSNFCSIKDSKISIVTKTPDELHYSAFSLELLIPINPTSKNLIIMALQTLEVETYDEWMNKIKENALTQKKLQRLDIGNGYYLGQVINGKKEGIGAYFFNNGGKFEGEFKNNTINGSGIYFWTNGRYFAGTWVNGKRTGYGIEVYENGTYTTQYWENEVLTQAPRPINPQRYNTSTGYYIGDLKDGKPHGRGTFYWDNGGSFEGTWVNNVIQGSGILRFANNGGVYVGCWKDGKRQFCYGLQCLSNGQKLIGYWENEVYRAKSIIIDNQ